jgi:hypothetical protein
MVRSLLVHPQEALHEPNLLYYMLIISVGCTSIGPPILLQATDITRAHYTKYCLCSAS